MLSYRTKYLHSLLTALLVVSMSVTCSAFANRTDEGDDLTPASFADGNADELVYAATSADPILLHKGTVTETATDLSLDTPIGEWEHTRTYQSEYKPLKDASECRDVHGQSGLVGRPRA